jgi:hypothetical protein
MQSRKLGMLAGRGADFRDGGVNIRAWLRAPRGFRADYRMKYGSSTMEELPAFDISWAGAWRKTLVSLRASSPGIATSLVAVVAQMFAPAAHASFLPPEMMDAAAMYIAWFVIVVVPIGAIVLFWLVHVMPEKIAHKRHHPQRDAIHTLCLLSLAFGGLLWPIAWLWAYTKPVGYRLAYGTEKHEDHYHELGEKAKAGQLPEHELSHLREELDSMNAKGTLSAELKVLRRDLDAAIPVAGRPEAAPPEAAPPSASAAVRGAKT